MCLCCMVMSPIIVSGQELTDNFCWSCCSLPQWVGLVGIYSNELSLSNNTDVISGTKVYAVHDRKIFGLAEAFRSQELRNCSSER